MKMIDKQKALALYQPMRKRADGALDSIAEFVKNNPQAVLAAGGTIGGGLLGRLVSGNWRGGLLGALLGGGAGYAGGGWWRAARARDFMGNQYLAQGKELLDTGAKLLQAQSDNKGLQAQVTGANTKIDALNKQLADAKASALTAAQSAQSKQNELQGQIDSMTGQLSAANARLGDYEKQDRARQFEQFMANNLQSKLPPAVGPTRINAIQRMQAKAEAARSAMEEATGAADEAGRRRDAMLADNEQLSELSKWFDRLSPLEQKQWLFEMANDRKARALMDSFHNGALAEEFAEINADNKGIQAGLSKQRVANETRKANEAAQEEYDQSAQQAAEAYRRIHGDYPAWYKNEQDAKTGQGDYMNRWRNRY